MTAFRGAGHVGLALQPQRHAFQVRHAAQHRQSAAHVPDALPVERLAQQREAVTLGRGHLGHAGVGEDGPCRDELVYDRPRLALGPGQGGPRAGHPVGVVVLDGHVHTRSDVRVAPHLQCRLVRVGRGLGHGEGEADAVTAAAQVEPLVLVDHGTDGHTGPVDLDLDALVASEPEMDLLALDAALDRLGDRDPQKARLVALRYFAVLTGDQAAAVLGISPSSADRQWVYTRAWLRRELGLGAGS